MYGVSAAFCSCYLVELTLLPYTDQQWYVAMSLIRYSHIYEAHINPALNGSSSVLQRFECSKIAEIYAHIIFDFYT